MNSKPILLSKIATLIRKRLVEQNEDVDNLDLTNYSDKFKFYEMYTPGKFRVKYILDNEITIYIFAGIYFIDSKGKYGLKFKNSRTRVLLYISPDVTDGYIVEEGPSGYFDNKSEKDILNMLKYNK